MTVHTVSLSFYCLHATLGLVQPLIMDWEDNPLVNQIPEDLAEKAAIMREFGRRRAAGEPVSEELLAKHVNATNDRYTTGPEPGEKIPDFTLPDQNGVLHSLAGLAGSNGLLVVFHRSADW